MVGWDVSLDASIPSAKGGSVRFLGKVSDVGDSPTLYATDRGTIVVQGWQVSDPDLPPTPAGEARAEIPTELLRFAPQPGAEAVTAELSDDDFYALFRDYRWSGLRLESRSHTDVPDERADVRAFLAGELTHERDELPQFWIDLLHRHSEMGCPLRRVRVMEEPCRTTTGT